MQLPAVSREVIDDDLALIDALQQPIGRLGWEVHQRAKAGPGVKVLTQLPGVGPFTALVIVAETGDVARFGSARKLAAWAGLTPTVPGSDDHAASANAAQPHRSLRPDRSQKRLGPLAVGLAAHHPVVGRRTDQTDPAPSSRYRRESRDFLQAGLRECQRAVETNLEVAD